MSRLASLGASVGGAFSGAWLPIAILVAAIVLPFLVSDFRTFQFTLVFVYAAALAGLVVVTGTAGLLSIGQSAFFGIGAYTTAIMMNEWDVPYGWTIPAAAVISFGIGALFGIPVIRLSRDRHSLLIVTVALAISLPQVIKRYDDFTGGSVGLVVPKQEDALGLGLNPDQWLYFLSLFVCLVTFFLAWNLLRTRPGRALVAMRDHQVAAASMGVNIGIYKVLAFAFGAAAAGVGGSVYALVIGFVSPDQFSFLLAVTFLTGVVVGGPRSLYGALIGGLFIQFVPVIVSDYSQDFQPSIVYGAVLILVAFLMPFGIAGTIQSNWLRVRRYLAAHGWNARAVRQAQQHPEITT